MAAQPPCAAAIARRLSRPGCPIFSLPLDADAFGVEKTGFARKLAARPQGAGGGCAMGRGLRILGFWFGRAGVAAGGWGYICCAAVYAAPWARWALPRPAKEPQVPWILHLLPCFWSVATRKIAGSSGDHRRAEPSGRTSPDQKRTAGAERPPRPRGLRRFCAVAVARRLSRPAWAPSMTARQRLLAGAAGRPTRRPLPIA